MKERILLWAVTALMFADIEQGFAANSNDGAGTMTVLPAVVPAGTTNNFAFTFTGPASGIYDAGSRVTLRVPLGWSIPQNTNASAPGFVQLSSVPAQASVSVRSINGTGPWTITIDITTFQPAAGFNLMYSSALSPTNAGIYAFKTHTKGGGGALTSLKIGSPTVTVIDLKRINTTTTLTSSANPIMAGAPVTFRAVVAPSGTGTPSGTVTFMDGDVLLGSSVVNSVGLATLSINNFVDAPDTHWISAEYLGDPNFNSSVSTTLAQNIVPTPQAPTISISLNPDGSAGLLCSGSPGQPYSVQATTNLLGGAWITLSTTAIGTNGLSMINDPDAPQYSSRFYRTMISY